MMDWDLILKIGAVIQLITVIVFFVMASNVAKIKKLLNKNELTVESCVNNAELALYIGNKKEALEYYLKAKYCHEEIKRPGAIYENIKGVMVYVEKYKLEAINEKIAEMKA